MQAKKNRYKILGILLLVVIVIAVGTGVYIGDYYPADDTALSLLADETSSVTIIEKENDTIFFLPENPTSGLIFYPGGKVQYEAYAPLLEKLAERGMLCVLVHMPGNLAVLDVNAADGIQKEYPDITRWYIGGHSLGGAMAASYVSKHSEEYEGLILLGAYSTVDLTDSGLSVVSIYGSEDGVLDMENYADNYKNLPASTREVVIEGGCHSYFGNYGMQDGDGTPTITREEQRNLTVEAICNQ
jgi:hypothetical protein